MFHHRASCHEQQDTITASLHKEQKMEEEDREMKERDQEGRGGNKTEKRKQLYRDPWVAEKLLVGEGPDMLRSINKTLKLSPDKLKCEFHAY